MRISIRWAVIGIATLLWLVPFFAGAQERPAADRTDKTLSPYFVVDGGDPSIDRLPLKDTRVDVSILGVIADVTVRQVYENRGERPIHARYVFPGSTRAAVYGMTMTIGETRIVAKIKEREAAKRDFDSAKRDGKSASLLEQSRPNVFTMNVANLLSGETIVVELKYTELLVSTDATYEFVYPTVVGPRYSEQRESQAAPQDRFVKAPYTHEGEAPRSDFHLSATLSTGVPIQDVTSPSHRVVAQAREQGRADIALADDERFSGNRDFILRYRLAGERIDSGLLLYRGRDENFFLLMVEPPRAVNADDVAPREYVFVIDVSGSMNGFPLQTAKALMADLGRVLRPTDRFNVVLFADGTATFSSGSVPATSSNLAAASDFIDRKASGGGTRLLPALKDGLAMPRQPGMSRSVVLLTDGYIDTEPEVFEYIRGHLDETNVFAFGIGSAVNRHLIEGVAHAGLGEPFVVTKPDEAPAAAAQFRRYIDSPILTGIGLTFEGFDAYDVEPQKIPDLFASRPIVVFGKFRGSVGGSIEISGTHGRDPYRRSIAVAPRSDDGEHRALRYLWARTRIGNLIDFAGPASVEQHREVITSLGLQYGLLTRYTSFIAVRELVRTTADQGEDVDQPLPLPQGVSDSAIGVTRGDEPELVWLCLLTAALFTVMAGAARTTRSRFGIGIVK